MSLDSPGSIVSPLGFLCLALACIGAITDWRTRRIPNWLVVWAFGLAIILRILGQEPLTSGLLGAGAALLVTLPLYAIHAIGAGDVKYLIAFGAVLGNGRIISALLLISIIGGIFALLSAITRGTGKTLFRESSRLVLYGISRGRLGSRRSLDTIATGPPPIPLGIAIAVGCVLVWFL